MTRPELLTSDPGCFAEGPVWDDGTATLLWVDLPRGEVHRLDPATGTDVHFAVGRPVGALARRARGGLVLAVAEGFAVAGPAGEDLTVLATVPLASGTARMNDGACDRRGRFWAGSMDRARPGACALFCLAPDAMVSSVLAGVSLSNGLDWCPDARVLYYADSRTGRVDVFDFDLDDGRLGERRAFVEIDRGRPDGLTVDADGCVWVALWEGGAVHRYDPRGRLERVVELPVDRVTSCAFGGPDLRVLFVTTTGATGGVFALQTDVAGLPPARWAG